MQQSRAENIEQYDMQIVGWSENGKLPGVKRDIKFKLDTGATTSSINAEILEQPDAKTESGGMIKFRYRDEDLVEQVYELPVVRWVKIESRTKDYIRRPVVRMKVCVAGRWIEPLESFGLQDRYLTWWYGSDRGPLLLEINARPGLSIQIANGEGLIGRLEAIADALPKLSNIAEKIEFAKACFHVGTS